MNVIVLVEIYFLINKAFADEPEIVKAMKIHEVIPDLLDEGPEQLLKVSYDSGVSASMGKELTPTQVQNRPVVEWVAEKGAIYTLLFTEIDAPSRNDTSLREWCHWLIVNIPENNIVNGDLLYDYQGSGPGKDTGFHRYVYLLFKQPEKLTFSEKYSPANSIEGRPRFSTKEFSKKYGLDIPVAGNFYLAQYDDYSDFLLAKLGLKF